MAQGGDEDQDRVPSPVDGDENGKKGSNHALLKSLDTLLNLSTFACPLISAVTSAFLKTPVMFPINLLEAGTKDD